MKISKTIYDFNNNPITFDFTDEVIEKFDILVELSFNGEEFTFNVKQTPEIPECLFVEFLEPFKDREKQQKLIYGVIK